MGGNWKTINLGEDGVFLVCAERMQMKHLSLSFKILPDQSDGLVLVEEAVSRPLLVQQLQREINKLQQAYSQSNPIMPHFRKAGRQ